MMDEETKGLDNSVRDLQELICMEYKQPSDPDISKVNTYLAVIQRINIRFEKNYSTNPKEYDITKLPCEGGVK